MLSSLQERLFRQSKDIPIPMLSSLWRSGSLHVTNKGKEKIKMQDLITIYYLISAMAAWLLAQFLKIFTGFFKEQKFSLKAMFFGTGGMPSSHSSFTMALSFSIAKYHGFDSPMFAIALIFSFVTMYDAQGIRRAAGRHAEILNDLILDHKMPDVGELKELLGHTPLEVAAGALLGILIGLWL